MEESRTHNECLMKLGAQQAFLPVIADDAADGLRQALLDGKVHARAVVDKLGIEARMVQGRRREAGGARRVRLLLLGLRRLALGGWVHDVRLRRGRGRGSGSGSGGQWLGLGLELGLQRRQRLVQRRERGGGRRLLLMLLILGRNLQVCWLRRRRLLLKVVRIGLGVRVRVRLRLRLQLR